MYHVSNHQYLDHPHHKTDYVSTTFFISHHWIHRRWMNSKQPLLLFVENSFREMFKVLAAVAPE